MQSSVMEMHKGQLRSQVLSLLTAEALDRQDKLRSLTSNELETDLHRLSHAIQPMTPAQSVLAEIDLTLLKIHLNSKSAKEPNDSLGASSLCLALDPIKKTSEEVVPMLSPRINGLDTDGMIAEDIATVKLEERAAAEVEEEEEVGSVEEDIEGGVDSSSQASLTSSSENDTAEEIKERSLSPRASPSTLPATPSFSVSISDSSSDSDTTLVQAFEQPHEPDREIFGPADDPVEASEEDPKVSPEGKGMLSATATFLSSLEDTQTPATRGKAWAFVKFRSQVAGRRLDWKTGVAFMSRLEQRFPSICCVEIGSLEEDLVVRGASVETVKADMQEETYWFNAQATDGRVLRFETPTEEERDLWVLGCQRRLTRVKDKATSSCKEKEKWWPRATVEGFLYERDERSSEEATLKFARLVETEGYSKLKLFSASEGMSFAQVKGGNHAVCWRRKGSMFKFKFMLDPNSSAGCKTLRVSEYLAVLLGNAGDELHIAPVVKKALQKVVNECSLLRDGELSHKSVLFEDDDEEEYADGYRSSELEDIKFEPNLPIQVIPLETGKRKRHSAICHKQGGLAARPQVRKGAPSVDIEVDISSYSSDEDQDIDVPQVQTNEILLEEKDKEETKASFAGTRTANDQVGHGAKKLEIKPSVSNRELYSIRQAVFRQIKGLRHKSIVKKNGLSFRGHEGPLTSSPPKSTKVERGMTNAASQEATESAMLSDIVVQRIERAVKVEPPPPSESSSKPLKAASSQGFAEARAAPSFKAMEVGSTSSIQDKAVAFYKECLDKGATYNCDEEEEFEDCIEESESREVSTPGQAAVGNIALMTDKELENDGSIWMMVDQRKISLTPCQLQVTESTIRRGEAELRGVCGEDVYFSINLRQSKIVTGEPTSGLLNALVSENPDDEKLCVRSMTNSFKIITGPNLSCIYELYCTGTPANVDNLVARLYRLGSS